jgi:hypothetical protein
MEAFVDWLRTTNLSQFMTTYTWAWPATETLHFIGLALLIGPIGLVDLRMLGLAKNVPFGPLHRLVMCGIAGFLILAATGVMFFVGIPEQYINNIAFQFKMVFVLLAGLNVLAFYVTVYEKAEALKPGEDAPTAAKVIAGVSLFLWVGVIYFGRMLPFIGNAF